MSTEMKVRSSVMKRVRRGLTLVESAMVLALLGLVIAGALLLYMSASTNNKVSEASAQMAAVAQAVRSVYAGQATYTGLNDTDIVRALPSKMSANNEPPLRHAFNNTITVAAAEEASAFTIEMDGLPQEGCVALATKDFGRAIQKVVVNGNAASLGRPYTPAAAQTACASNDMTITWTMY